MRDDIKIKNTPKDELINKIVEIEWIMFDKVLNEGGRASCQNDEWTFYTMRYSQFSAFNVDTLSSYLQDLNQANATNINLLASKYAYMMEYTDPAYYESTLKPYLPPVPVTKEGIVNIITDVLVHFEDEFSKAYPYMADKGRPTLGMDRNDVSFRTYTLGELKTYSLRTLKLYLSHLDSLATRGINPSYEIHAVTARFYGYNSLEEAELKIKNG